MPVAGPAADTGLVVSSRPAHDPDLPAQWHALQDRGAVQTPFLRWEWFAGFAQVPEVAEQVRVLSVAKGETVVGLFPVERVAGPGPLRTLGPAGWRWLAPDHLDVVAEPGMEQQVAEAVVDHLAADRSWDLLDLDGLRPDAALLPALRRLVLPRHYRWPEQAVRAPYVDLRPTASDDASPGSGTARDLIPSKNLRKQVGRGLRVAQARGGGLVDVTDPDEVVGAVEALMPLHLARFGETSAVFATDARRRFHRVAARELASAGLARVYRLSAAGTDAGLLYVLRLGDVAYAYAIGMAPDTTLSPGRTVYGQAILSAAQEGLREFDLLRGEHDYKVRFSSGVRSDVRVRVARLHPRLVAFAATRLPARLLARVRSTRAPTAPEPDGDDGASTP